MLVPALTLLVRWATESFNQSVRTGIALILVPVLIAPFIASLRLMTPARYMTNPKFERNDVGLGTLTIGSVFLFVFCPVLMFIAADGQSSPPALFVSAGVAAGVGAGALNELARRRFPNAWTPQTRVSTATERRTINGISGQVTIRPTRATPGIATAFLGGLSVLIIYTDIRQSTVGPELVVLAVLIGLVGFILRLTAGCDEERVWFAWRSVDRARLKWFELRRVPRFGYDRGALSLLDSAGTLVLRIPTLFFADDDIDRLVTALALPQMPLAST